MSGRVGVSTCPGSPFAREGAGMFRRFIVEEDAQELMEYLYLCAFVALIGILVWNNIVTFLGNDYSGFNTGTQGIWTEPDPP
jgi:Flp pilus assembly pilin Flp